VSEGRVGLGNPQREIVARIESTQSIAEANGRRWTALVKVRGRGVSEWPMVMCPYMNTS
jgi:hypothetical protein